VVLLKQYQGVIVWALRRKPLYVYRYVAPTASAELLNEASGNGKLVWLPRGEFHPRKTPKHKNKGKM
jgi:hypothetical protein